MLMHQMLKTLASELEDSFDPLPSLRLGLFFVFLLCQLVGPDYVITAGQA